MHEFSLAIEVIRITELEAEKNRLGAIREITIEIGDLSGVDAGAFATALELLATDSLLSEAKINLVRMPGIGHCLSCNKEFKMEHRMAYCPDCRSFPSIIKGGEEFSIRSLLGN